VGFNWGAGDRLRVDLGFFFNSTFLILSDSTSTTTGKNIQPIEGLKCPNDRDPPYLYHP
jgi:hypothetical protein